MLSIILEGLTPRNKLLQEQEAINHHSIAFPASRNKSKNTGIKRNRCCTGIAKKGPMVKDNNDKGFAYQELTGLTMVSGLSLRVSAIAITPVNGKPTPLMQKPAIAINRLSPAC